MVTIVFPRLCEKAGEDGEGRHCMVIVERIVKQ